MGDEKKDLTGILELSRQTATEPVSSAPAADLDPTVPIAPPENAPENALDRVRKFSEQAGVPTTANASFPFSLTITGKLLPEEREKLVDVLNRENMGIREIDLEPQFECGRVLIPRISEYAGVLIVQALRGASAQMRLGPSDSIFATEDTRSSPLDFGADYDFNTGAADTGSNDDTTQPASTSSTSIDDLPVTAASSIPGVKTFRVLDVVTASATLHTNAVDAENTTEYRAILEALHRELKHRAFHKGASAILNYSVQLMPLHLPSHYRLTVLGTAITTRTATKDSSPVNC